jgi:hypothetical protein
LLRAGDVRDAHSGKATPAAAEVSGNAVGGAITADGISLAGSAAVSRAMPSGNGDLLGGAPGSTPVVKLDNGNGPLVGGAIQPAEIVGSPNSNSNVLGSATAVAPIMSDGLVSGALPSDNGNGNVLGSATALVPITSGSPISSALPSGNGNGTPTPAADAGSGLLVGAAGLLARAGGTVGK